MTDSYFKRHLPKFSEDQFENLISAVKDYQITHGSLLKLVKTDEEHTVLVRPVGSSLYPTQFPRDLFEIALNLQKCFNKLYVKVAEDEEWLKDTLSDLIVNDQLTRILWNIHEEVKKMGYVQPVSLGIFRSDYMVHRPSPGSAALKQVEFNSYTVAGGTHGNIVYNMHRHLFRTGAYRSPHDTSSPLEIPPIPPTNETISGIGNALVEAHKLYGPPVNPIAAGTGVLMIVQPFNFNICDERPIEYELWNEDPPIPCYRVTFSDEVLQYLSLGPSRELLYKRHPYNESPLEISVCYMRGGHEPREYSTTSGLAARLQLERSRAIKVPSLLSHLTTYKKVQQRLSMPGEVERFLDSAEAAAVRSTFVPMYPLDNSLEGSTGRTLATSRETVGRYIMKPCLEGGGHNIYGYDILNKLRLVPEVEWRNCILMEKIKTPLQDGILMSGAGLYKGLVVSELGVFGACLWKKRTEGGAEVLENRQFGWSFKTKAAEVDEMSVVKGYGCFDSPFLVDI